MRVIDVFVDELDTNGKGLEARTPVSATTSARE